MRNRVLLIIFILLLAAPSFCLADKQNYDDAMKKAQKEQNEYFEKLSNCVSGNYPFFITVFGIKNNICQSQLVSPIQSETGLKYQVDNCNMPKNIFKSYINDIKDLSPEQYQSKWEATHDKYCKTEYRDNY